MASFPIRAGFFGWGGMAGKTGAVATVGGVGVAITYARALRTAPAFAQFTATVNGVARGVSAATVTGSTLSLTLAAPNLVAGDRIVITYTPGGTAGTRMAYLGPPVEEFPASTIELTA
jgi:uncharacterized repeat protein (TIGR02059 family)